MEHVDKITKGGSEFTSEELAPRQKVAVLMVSLGRDNAAEIMKFLTDIEIEIEEITHTITQLKHLPVEVQDQVLGEFEQHLLAGEYMSQGGEDFARDALERAVGPRRAQEILDRISTTVSSGFYLLKNVPPEQLAPSFRTNTRRLLPSSCHSSKPTRLLAFWRSCPSTLSRKSPSG